MLVLRKLLILLRVYIVRKDLVLLMSVSVRMLVLRIRVHLLMLMRLGLHRLGSLDDNLLRPMMLGDLRELRVLL